jgi:hypothetical protein
MATKKVKDESLIEQALELYYYVCRNEYVAHEEPDPELCDIGRQFIYLNNKSKVVARLDMSDEWIRLSMFGNDYERKIKKPTKKKAL